MKTLKYLTMVMAVGLFISCEDDEGAVDVGTDPEIVSVRIKTGWNLLSEDPVAVEVVVKDPQGASNLSAVTIDVKNDAGEVLFSDSLFDDGSVLHPEAGDVFARDGVFRNQFKAASISDSEGIFRFEMRALDRDGNNSETFEIEVQFGFNELPVIVSVSGADSLISGGEGILYAAVYDKNGNDEVRRVLFDLYQDDDKLTPEPVEMLNDGDFTASGDLFPDDSIYAYKMKPSFAAGRHGWYELRFSAVDDFEEPGAEKSKDIYLENKTGRIVSVSKPDRIEKPTVTFNPSDTSTYNSALVEVEVTDPQTLADVDSVYFFSRKPDGELARDGAPLILVDNGLPFNISNPFTEAGDAVEGDGIYSLTVIIFNDPETQLGMFEWSFYMRDRAGNLTPVTVDSIEVYQ